MIGYLKGDLITAEEGTVIINVNGVGYEIICSAAAFRQTVNAHGGELFIYTAVKEDGISLYGFISQEEKRIFLQLVSVSGVGPKMGIAVLSDMGVKELVSAIATGDVKRLSAVKGLGKKTAERIILELRDKMGAISDANSLALEQTVSDESADDAVNALMGLGFSRAESVAAVKKAKLSGATTIQQTIAYALKSMR